MEFGDGRGLFGAWNRSLRDAKPALVSVAAAMLVVTALIGATVLTPSVNPKMLLDDPARHLGGSPLVGVFSVLGVLAWIVVAATGFAALATTSRGRTADRRLIRIIAISSLVLWFDDQFMIHDGVLRYDLGVSELWLTGPYIVGAGWIVATTWRSILDHPDGLLLLLAVAALGTSLLIDISAPPVLGRNAIEDLAKLSGLLFWAQFGVRASLRLIRSEVDGSAAPADTRTPRDT